MKPRKVSSYGRIAVGQVVNYSTSIIAPTNSAIPCRCCRDKTTGKIIHPDESFGFDVNGQVVDLTITESGCMATVAVPGGGVLKAHINGYGQDNGNFKMLRVVREAPTQMELR